MPIDDEVIGNVTVLIDWIAKELGEEAAIAWLWELTDFPHDWPTPAQMLEGMLLASHEITIGELLAERVSDEEDAYTGHGGDA